jgi:hypothetical protein
VDDHVIDKLRDRWSGALRNPKCNETVRQEQEANEAVRMMLAVF